MRNGTLFSAITFAIVIAPPFDEACLGDEAIVEDAIRRLANGPHRLAAKRELELAANDEVVPKLVQAILADPAFADTGLRYLAYQVLYNQRAAQIPEGFDLLLRGIEDEENAVALVSIRALRLAPTERYGEIVDAFDKLLPMAKPEVKSEIYLTAAGVGTAAVKLKASAAAEFRDSDDTSVVFAATFALLRFGSPEPIIERVKNVALKPNALRGVMMALARFGGETGGSFNIDQAKRNALRKIVIDGLAREEEDVRSTAIQSLIHVFGEEAVLKEGSRFIVNPSLEAALQKAGASGSTTNATRQQVAQASDLVRAWVMARERIESDGHEFGGHTP